MGHRADELARRVARQLVSVSSVITYLTLAEHGGRADDEREAVPSGAAQQRVEVGQLAALALVAHPDPLLRVPAARAMEQEERCRLRTPRRVRRAAVSLVELLDSLRAPARAAPRPPAASSTAASRKSVSSAKCRFGSRLARKRTSSASTRLVDALCRGEHRRDHHQRAGVGGIPAEKSMRGSGCGVTSSVASQFTMPTASWLVASSSRTPRPASAASPTPSARACDQAAPTVSAAGDRRDRARGREAGPSAFPRDGASSKAVGRIVTACSRRGSPLSIR